MSWRPSQVSLFLFAAHLTNGLSNAVEASTFGSLTRYRETKFIIGFDFAVTLSSFASSCSFRHRFKIIYGTELADVEQTQKMIPFVTCQVSFGHYLCELVFGVDVFDLDLGVKLILSNNHSRATLWVLETCLIVGLLPFMVILITASLSSKIYNKASLREESTFEEIKSTLPKSSIIP